MSDYRTLHHNCSCMSEGWIGDGFYAQDECSECWEPFGFDVPIRTDEGRLRVHKSCEEQEAAL